MKALGAFCERVQDVLYSGGMALQCQNEAESTHVPFQASKAETREGQVWQSLTLQVMAGTTLSRCFLFSLIKR